MAQTKDFRFEVKAATLNEDGTFVGLASTYGNIDLGDDEVMPGAFTKTLKERGSRVPLLWSHDPKQPIGIGDLEDSSEGLVVKGQLDLDTQAGKDAYSRLKKGIIKGLSIGYETVKKTIKDNVRQLTELKLLEVSLCVFPMNEKAIVTAVKTNERKDDFLMELEEAQTWAFRYQALDALSCSLCDTLMDSEMDDAAKADASSTAIQQFHDKYLEMLPAMSALMADEQGMGMMSAPPTPEQKAGRRISAATRKRIESVMKELQTLLENEAAQSTSGDGAVAADANAKATVIEPDFFHSLADRYTKSLQGVR